MGAEISAVQAHGTDHDALGRETLRERDDLRRARFRVVRVHEQRRVLRVSARETFERLHLAVVRLDERVRHRAVGRNPEAHVGEHGGGAVIAGEIRRPRRKQAGLRAVRAPQAEIHQQLSAACQNRPRGLGRDQRLELKQVDEARLHQLRLRKRRGHPQQRLVRKADRAFRHRVHVAPESKPGQPVEESRRKALGLREPVDFRRGEAKVLQVLDYLLQSRRHEKIAIVGQFPGEELEYRGVFHAVRVVRRQHGELVQVGEQRARARIAGHRPLVESVRTHCQAASASNSALCAPRRRICASARAPSSGFTSTARIASVSRITS